jgi:hypothetical protein
VDSHPREPLADPVPVGRRDVDRQGDVRVRALDRRQRLRGDDQVELAELLDERLDLRRRPGEFGDPLALGAAAGHRGDGPVPHLRVTRAHLALRFPGVVDPERHFTHDRHEAAEVQTGSGPSRAIYIRDRARVGVVAMTSRLPPPSPL